LETKFNLIHGDQIFQLVKPNSIVLEYAIPQDPQRLQPILTGQPRMQINNEWFGLFTRLKNYYRVTIRGFLPSDLQNEEVMRKLINFLEPKIEERKRLSLECFQNDELNSFKSGSLRGEGGLNSDKAL